MNKCRLAQNTPTKMFNFVKLIFALTFWWLPMYSEKQLNYEMKQIRRKANLYLLGGFSLFLAILFFISI